MKNIFHLLLFIAANFVIIISPKKHGSYVGLLATSHDMNGLGEQHPWDTDDSDENQQLL